MFLVLPITASAGSLRSDLYPCHSSYVVVAKVLKATNGGCENYVSAEEKAEGLCPASYALLSVKVKEIIAIQKDDKKLIPSKILVPENIISLEVPINNQLNQVTGGGVLPLIDRYGAFNNRPPTGHILSDYEVEALSKGKTFIFSFPMTIDQKAPFYSNVFHLSDRGSIEKSLVSNKGIASCPSLLK